LWKSRSNRKRRFCILGHDYDYECDGVGDRSSGGPCLFFLNYVPIIGTGSAF
jgi:hypothetical protein